jgi:hypothetical protein
MYVCYTLYSSVFYLRWNLNFYTISCSYICHTTIPNYHISYMYLIKNKFRSQRMVPLVEALRYKPECREFDSRWGQWDFSLTSSARTVALGSTQQLTETSARHRSSSTGPGIFPGVDCLEILKPWSVQACKGIVFYILFGLICVRWFAKHAYSYYSYWAFK